MNSTAATQFSHMVRTAPDVDFISPVPMESDAFRGVADEHGCHLEPHNATRSLEGRGRVSVLPSGDASHFSESSAFHHQTMSEYNSANRVQ